MSLDKAIKHGKEKRKELRGSRAISGMCYNLSCAHCAQNKKHRDKRREPIEQDHCEDMLDMVNQHKAGQSTE